MFTEFGNHLCFDGSLIIYDIETGEIILKIEAETKENNVT